MTLTLEERKQRATKMTAAGVFVTIFGIAVLTYATVQSLQPQQLQADSLTDYWAGKWVGDYLTGFTIMILGTILVKVGTKRLKEIKDLERLR